MNILCFGDSNTWGFDADNLCRYPKEVRWAGKLCEYLDPGDEVFEFGICDMTFGTDDPFYRACNGYKNIIPAIRANSPLDYVVVSLGVNDCKKYLFNTDERIIKDAGRLIFLTKKYSDLNTSSPKVIVCGQLVATSDISKYYPTEFDSSSAEQIYQVSRELKRFCKSEDIPYFKFPQGMKFCNDGCHYSAEGHELFAKELATFIKSL